MQRARLVLMTRRGARHRGISRIAGRVGAALLASAVALTFAENSNAQVLAATGTDASRVPTAPPPLGIPYVQFGVALTTEFVADGGKMCTVSPPPTCILGSGGGVVARVGRRSAGPWYFGGAYELSKQDPSNLYRFATLQQLRAEARWYLDTGRDIYPYVTAGSGVATYGDEWNIDTYGPVETVGIGVEAQVSRRTVVGLAVSYRFLVFNDHLSSGSTYESGASVVQIVGLDLFVEERAPIVSALSRAPATRASAQTQQTRQPAGAE
jgi:hypothetical protein